MDMKYWVINENENKATLIRKVYNNNRHLITHLYANLKTVGIRFLIRNDNLLTLEEQEELLYII